MKLGTLESGGGGRHSDGGGGRDSDGGGGRDSDGDSDEISLGEVKVESGESWEFPQHESNCSFWEALWEMAIPELTSPITSELSNLLFETTETIELDEDWSLSTLADNRDGSLRWGPLTRVAVMCLSLFEEDFKQSNPNVSSPSFPNPGDYLVTLITCFIVLYNIVVHCIGW